MKKIVVVGLLLSLILSACAQASPRVEDGISDVQQVVIYAEDG